MLLVRWSKVAVLVVAALALCAATVGAQEMTGVSCTITASFTVQDTIEVGSGYTMSMGTSEGVTASTGEVAFMDGAKTSVFSFANLMDGNGPHQGHTMFAHEADTVFAMWEGQITTVMSEDGAPSTTFEGILTFTAGTGRFANVQGGGGYVGRFTGETSWVADCDAEYFIAQ